MPARAEIVAGDDGVGIIEAPLGPRPGLRVIDDEGAPVSGVGLEWEVVAGGGAIEPVTAATDDDGRAEARWTLGPEPGENQVRARVDALDTAVVFVATAIPELEPRPERALASGADHACALSTDGTAFCWGRNGHGQLGDGGYTDRDRLAPVEAGVEFVGLAAGTDHTCGVTARGEAHCWGRNESGELGDGSRDDRTEPIRVSGDVRFRTLAAGTSHTCGITLARDAYCWGEGEGARLGTGTRADRASPARVDADFAFTAIAAGRDHSCGLDSDGRAYCWGSNVSGELGTGDFESHQALVPAPVDTELRFVSLSSGSGHNCAVSTGGGTYCWGLDGAMLEDHFRPHGPIGSIEFTAVAAGRSSDFNCGLDTSGRAHCWGLDGHAQLGDGDGPAPDSCPAGDECSRTPVPVDGDLSFDALALGRRHACGLSADGTVFCWGNRGYGQVGDGARGYVPWPRPVVGGLDFASISAGGGFTCGVDASGAAHCWGANDAGELGTGGTEPARTPTPVTGSHDFESVRSSPGFTCGLTSDGDPLCWGGYPPGPGQTTGVTEPTAPIDAMTLATFDVGGDVAQQLCGISPDDELYCWEEVYGDPPTRVFGTDTLVSVTAGDGFRCGLSVDGVAYCWGRNFDGQLGTGDREERNEPAPVAGGHRFDSLDAGDAHACGVTTDGAAYCWGYGPFGQLGDGVMVDDFDHDRTTPHPVDADGVDFRSIVAGETHTCALTDAGTAYCWGTNATGQLGDGGYTDRATPVRVDTDLAFATLAVGGRGTFLAPDGHSAHTCGITTDGAAYCWGDGTDGQLGTEPGALAHAPVALATDIAFGAGRAPDH
ncbi:MAG: RCC1 domain-containing protein [Gemmatimonadota bacterium]